MSLITSNPFQAFKKSLGKSPVKMIQVASPFITIPGVQMLIEEFGRKRTKFQVLTNLSDINVALSLSNPVAPILLLMEKFGDRIEVKSHPRLHAKLYLCESRAALLGSSNLTFGGMQKNAEINWIVTGRKDDDKKQLLHLRAWFEEAWHRGGKALTSEYLQNTMSTWENTMKQVRAHLTAFIPEPRLAGDYWQKTRKITSRKQWPIKSIEKLLSESDDGSSKNSGRKLIFLKNLGLVDFDEKRVSIIRKMTSQLEMYSLLESGNLSISLNEILRSFISSKSDRMTFRSMAEVLGVLHDDDALRGGIKWLESLGYVKRHRNSSFHEFTLKPKIRELDIG